MSKNLSDRATLLLWIVDQHTEKDWGTGELKRFFVPASGMYHYRKQWSGDLGFTYISGSGDSAAFRGLERRGFIRRPRPAMSGDYLYELTEEGLQYVVEHELRERFEL